MTDRSFYIAAKLAAILDLERLGLHETVGFAIHGVGIYHGVFTRKNLKAVDIKSEYRTNSL